MADAGVPWDQRLARRLVRPLVGTGVRPNHLTLLALTAGFAAAALFAVGPPWSKHLAAGLFMLAIFLDHTDGELARATGTTSRFGHMLDRLTSLCNYTFLFVGIGVGLEGDPTLGPFAIYLGLIAGLSVSGIFAAREIIARRHGSAMIRMPSGGGFEVEDIMYGVGPVTWLGGLAPFLVIAALGAPAFLSWTLLRRSHGSPGG